MGTILDEETDTVSEAQKREAYNAKISENYKRLIEGNVSDLKEEATSENTHRKYDSLDAYKPLHARKEITFEDVQVPEELMANAQARPQARPVTEKAPAPTRENIFTSKEYVEAANRMATQTGVVFAPEVRDETLSVPTGTTLQYGATQTAENIATKPASVASVQSVAAERSQYYAQLLKKVIAIFAVAVVVLLVAITVNSAVLRGMDVRLSDLQGTLEVLRKEVEALQQSVQNETSMKSILEFISRVGMIKP